MSTITLEISDVLERRMNNRDDIAWNDVIRQCIEAKLDERDRRDLGRAVAMTERVFYSIDTELASDVDSAAFIRQCRDGEQRQTD